MTTRLIQAMTTFRGLPSSSHIPALDRVLVEREVEIVDELANGGPALEMQHKLMEVRHLRDLLRMPTRTDE